MKARRILFSVAGGILLLVLFVAATWSLSINFPAEGADTLAARRVALTYSWVFSIAHSLGIHGLPGTALILGAPVLVYSAIVFVILSSFGIPRHTPHHELPRAGNA